MLGLIVLVTAILLLLSLVTYNPADPSLNTVGGGAGVHPAHNWTGLIGAYLADILLQVLGVAVLLAPGGDWPGWDLVAAVAAGGFDCSEGWGLAAVAGVCARGDRAAAWTDAVARSDSDLRR